MPDTLNGNRAFATRWRDVWIVLHDSKGACGLGHISARLESDGTVNAGRKGPPTGLSHAYEVKLPENLGRSFWIWTEDDGRFVGFGDERESMVAAEDEATARAFIAAQRP